MLQQSHAAGDRPMIQGKCLCGQVSYSLQSELLFLYNCHCVQCRQFSGASFATNATVTGADFTVKDPNGKLRHFATGGGNRYFCSDCGSSIYSAADDGEFPSLHCGTISNPPDKALEANMWTSERCPWVEIDDSIKGYERSMME